MRCEEGNLFTFPSNPDLFPASIKKRGVPLGEDYKSVRTWECWEEMDVKVQVRAQDGLSSK